MQYKFQIGIALRDYVIAIAAFERVSIIEYVGNGSYLEIVSMDDEDE